MKQTHRAVRLADGLVHVSWFAIDETFCGDIRPLSGRFTSNPVTCIECIATGGQFPPYASPETELEISRRYRAQALRP